MNKKLLILTGPQGSGNHMWSKIFSQSEKVQGWTQLTKNYWVTHGLEPFTNIWKDPELFKEIDFPHEYYFTSISCPFITAGGPVLTDDNGIIPKYDRFIEGAKEAGFDVTIAAIGRDVNILSHQQQRVRTRVTWPLFIEQFDTVLKKYNPLLVSTELLFLYKRSYIQQLEQLLNWPIDISDEALEEILKDNTNQKYLKYVDNFWLDEHMKATAIVYPSDRPVNSPYVYNKIKKDNQ